MAFIKCKVLYFCAAITSCIMGNPINNQGVQDSGNSHKDVEMDNCVRNFEERGGNNVTLDSFNSTINKARNLNMSDKSISECKFVKRSEDKDYATVITNGSTRTEGPELAVSLFPSRRPKSKTVLSAEHRTKLQFPECPSGETIASEKLREHHLPFSVFSTIMGFLQPTEFPLELLKDGKERRVPFHVLLLQVVKLEGLAAAWILLWAILSLCIPCAAIAQICCPAKKLQRLENHSSNSTINASEDCTNRSMGLFMHLLLIIFITNLALMIASNEQLTKSITSAPDRAGMVFDDLEKFTKNNKMQMTFVTVMTVDRASDAIEKDLDDVEALIGIPFQQELRTTFGLEEVFKTLKTIQEESREISRKVKAVILTSKTGRDAGKSLEEQLEELIPMMSNIHQQCSVKDRPLCETLLSSGLAVTFRTDEILKDLKLKYLAATSDDLTFNITLEESEINFKDIPKQLSLNTEKQRSKIHRSLQQRRMAIHKALRAFEDLSRSTIGTIKTSKRKLVPLLEDIASRDLWRYLTILEISFAPGCGIVWNRLLVGEEYHPRYESAMWCSHRMPWGISILIFILWTTLMCGAPCGCENVSRAIPYLIIGLTFACLISLLLWIVGSAALLLGIHGQNIICNAFYDPNYTALSHLLDDNGIMYSKGGFFMNLLKHNESIKVADVLRNSERNQSSYKTFKLKNVANIENLVDYNNWIELKISMDNFRIQPKHFKILSNKLEPYLIDLNSASYVNLTFYRKQANSPITAKDLSAFLDQVYAIAKQTTDSRTGSRLEKLTLKLRDVMNKDYKRLNEIKETLFYELTALDVVLKQFREKCDGLLAEIRKIQEMMDTRMETISKQISDNFMGSLKNYLELAKSHIDWEIMHHVARLKPLWNIYVYTRVYVCEEFIGALNAFAFSCYFSILLIITLTPITKRIIKRYREINEDLLGRIHYRNADVDGDGRRNGSSGWETPRSPGTPLRRNQNDESVWASPRQSISDDLPPPPRPSSSSGRSSSPRPPVPSVSKTVAAFGSKYETSRYDSLKLIERSTWRTPGSPEATPRRWI